MKKVLFMLSSMNIGGVEKSLLSLLSEIPKNKYDITILLLERKGGFLGKIPNWVKVEEVNWYQEVKPIIMQPPQQTIKNYATNHQYINILTFIYSYLLSKYFNNRYYYYKQIFKRIPVNTNSYDIAISYQGPTDIIDYYIGNNIRASRKISWVHFDISKHKINKKLYTKMYKKFNQIYVVSKLAKQRLIEQIPTIKGKTDVFMNLVPVNQIKKMATEIVKFDENYKGIKIVTVGRLSLEKGQDLAIKALAMLLDKGYNVRWYCIGDGNCRKDYEQMIKEYNLTNDFILLGSTSNPYPYIANADIYVQSSRHEGFCLTLAEAKCLAKPIITTNFTGAYEQLKNDYNGFIVNCNYKDLYEKIKYVIDNPKERNKLISNLKNTDYKNKIVSL